MHPAPRIWQTPVGVHCRCDECSGVGMLTDRHPLDPSGREWACVACDGYGEVLTECERCRDTPYMIVDDVPLCIPCAQEVWKDEEE
jgi:hypothetical protein